MAKLKKRTVDAIHQENAVVGVVDCRSMPARADTKKPYAKGPPPPVDRNYDTVGGVIEVVKELADDRSAAVKDRLAAIKQICDIRGFKSHKDYSDLRRKPTAELTQLTMDVVIPALAAYGVIGAQDIVRVTCPKCTSKVLELFGDVPMADDSGGSGGPS